MKIVKYIFILFLVIVLIHFVHAVTLDRIIEYKEITFSSSDIPSEMIGYRIAFVSDTHTLPKERLTEVVEVLNGKQVDLFLLGGDFYYKGGEPLRAVEILSKVTTKDGIYGVEGNHDSHRKLFPVMNAHTITPLANSGVYVGDNFYLAGVEDLWKRKPNITKAVEGSKREDFVLVIAHNPDITMLQDTTGVDLVLSGHTHGGQINFLGLWAPYFAVKNTVTDYGQRFRSGWASSRDGTPVYVSNGTGNYCPRVFARPQVILLTLLRSG
jgi:predicted MPP superfamily phosphohydrolase